MHSNETRLWARLHTHIPKRFHVCAFCYYRKCVRLCVLFCSFSLSRNNLLFSYSILSIFFFVFFMNMLKQKWIWKKDIFLGLLSFSSILSLAFANIIPIFQASKAEKMEKKMKKNEKKDSNKKWVENVNFAIVDNVLWRLFVLGCTFAGGDWIAGECINSDTGLRCRYYSKCTRWMNCEWSCRSIYAHKIYE